ncbi:hypothetical protein P691DRAFT_850165 [Macrolepiota fuliginosa MF-IS2]|uniref:NACHT domain-containing protein n=1 Tax=Macrolepiota fuliginosa MF-IS2 TaxID=1400762 RepID=A0A9P5XF41_9AGAR|nr:hypothetical protein P691DRAFT_850165 [Macrolepiota fuliginosa MF-IS2]
MHDIALERLAEHTMPGAAFDSSAEESPSRCHSGTRHYIMNDVHSWFNTRPRNKNMLWISGPAGVGKTAIMRSVADVESRYKRLGATIFFSRANKRDDPAQFVPTLIYQLAVGIPSYQEFLKDQMTADPQLLLKGSKALFGRLIVEPFGHQKICDGMDPLLILIDGLDECDGGEHTQRGIVEMISNFVQQFPGSPLVWVIASRPEPWLWATFLRVEHNCRREYIAIDAEEAQKDVELYLRDEFATMRKDRPDLIPYNRQWPSELQIRCIFRAASGLFVFASTVIRFVRDPNVANPVGQLLIVLAAIENLGFSSQSGNPLSILHDLYVRILKAMSRPTYAQVTKRILGCCDLLPRNTFHPTTFMLSCNFLGIEQHAAYAALQKLHSVLDIPSQNEAATREIRVLHASFTDFLRNHKGSREYHVGRPESGADIVRSSFRILQEANKSSEC